MAPPQQAYCKRGHLLADDNLLYQNRKSSNGVVHKERYCKECANRRARSKARLDRAILAAADLWEQDFADAEACMRLAEAVRKRREAS